MPREHKLGKEVFKDRSIPVNACPRCRFKNLKDIYDPVRPVVLAKDYDDAKHRYMQGDKHRCECSTSGCGWWSESTYNEHKREWIMVVAKRLSSKERGILDERIRKMKRRSRSTTTRKRARP